MPRTLLLVGILSFFAASACQGPLLPKDPGDSILVGRATDALGLDPARITDSESAEVCEQIFEHLVSTETALGAYSQGLATHWDVAQNGTEFTFHLRDKVLFHDGTPCDADAVIFSFERQRDPTHPFHRPDFAYEPMFHNIVRLEKIDRLTVKIVIERAYAPFIANLSMFPMSIVSPTAVARWGEAFKDHPVGTGPFRFVEWAHGDRITLEANPDYWQGPPKVKHLAFVPIANPRQRLVSLEGGAIDVAESLAPQDLQFIALHPELKTHKVAGENVGYLAMNTAHPPFDDLRVRRAISLAINKDPIVKLVYQGFAIPATGPLPPSAWAYLKLPVSIYDPARARALLDEAGYDRGRKKRPKLYVASTARQYMPAPEQVAQMIAQNLREVGVEVEVVVNDMNEHIRATSAGEHDLCLLGWSGDNGDPDNFLYTLFHSENTEGTQARNLSFFRDPQLDGILRWAQETLDHGLREKYYLEAQQIIADKVPWVPIAHAEIVVAQRRSVEGLLFPAAAVLDFRAATVKRP